MGSGSERTQLRGWRWAALGALLSSPLIFLGAATALGGDLPQSAAGMTEPVTISRLVIRFRPGVHPAEGERLGEPLLRELRAATGHPLSLGSPTRSGDQVLLLDHPASVPEARRLLGTLRMRPDVLWAEFERSTSGAVGAKAAAAAKPAPLIRQFIVTFSDPATAVLARNNQRLGAQWDALLSQGAGVPMHVLRPTVGGAWIVAVLVAVSRERAAELAAALEATPGIRYAAPDYPVSPHAYFPNDPYFQDGHQRNLANPLTTPYYGIDAPDAWDITKGSALVIAVVDTGARPHDEFASRLLDGYDFISDATNSRDGLGPHASGIDPGNWRSDTDCPGKTAQDSDWHGTHVTGIIGASGDNNEGIAGINWFAKMLPVRVLGTCGGNTSDIQQGMTWAAGLPVPGFPDNLTPARVINMSLGGAGPCDAQYQSVINEVLAQGTFIAVSAGNGSVDISAQNPADCFGVSTVAATDPYGFLASYSNFGAGVDVAAPGGDQSALGALYGIWSTLNTGTTVPEFSTFADYSGTSQAAPHVSGVASLMLTVNPALSPAQIKTIMANTASAFAPMSNCRTSGTCGPGIVNAYAAVNEALRLANNLTTVFVIEFYDAALDHYFISSLQPDIDALDSGHFPGWVRTGQTFNANAQTTAGENPVCRFYLPPPQDSHFYSASADECAAVAAKFPTFIYESPNVMYIGLPDPNSGACPAATIPVYRLYNNRVDANHRYTTDLAIKAQMVAKGYIPEGYGPDAVIMCAPQ
ncbi:MAG TPA: S8 family peptidase [Casimicrobiaceae bacterium]|jgi:serine protease|nr:S8 family peptidase [Casimicrobiaceae bacterium]